MRWHSQVGALVVIGLAMAVGSAAAEEKGGIWPWNRGEGASAPKEESTFSSPLADVKWPEVKMPEFKMKPLFRPAEDGTPGMLQESVEHFQAGTRSAFQKTQSAWNSTVDRVKMRMPGGADTQPQVAEAPRQGMWQKWFGPAEETPTAPSAPRFTAQHPPATSTR